VGKLDRLNSDFARLRTHVDAGFPKRSFIPRVRLRVRDFFSAKPQGESVVIPSIALGADGRANDAGLLGLDVSRRLGAQGSGSASVVFANKLGAMYRSQRQKNLPTIEEQYFGIPTDRRAAADQHFRTGVGGRNSNKVAEYMRDVIQQGFVRSDIAIERQEIIRELNSGVLQGLFRGGLLGSDQADLLLEFMRIDLLYEMMAPIEIDLQDLNERYFGIFTGHVSSVEDSYEVGAMPQVRLSCYDKMSLFAKTFVVTRAVLQGIENVAPTNVDLLTRGTEAPSIYDDKFSEFVNWEVFVSLVQTINQVYTLQGHLQTIQGFLTSDDPFTNSVARFVSEELSGTPAELMAALDEGKVDDLRGILEQEFVTLENSFVKDGRLFSVNRDSIKRAYKSADFDKLLSGKRSPKDPKNLITPRLKHSFLYRLWSLPNFRKLGVNDDGTALPALLPSRSAETAFSDYKGLSNYWPNQNSFVQNVRARGFLELAKSKFSQLEADVEDKDVPFRVTGIAQFDNKFLGLAADEKSIAQTISKALRVQYDQFLNNLAQASQKLAQVESKSHCHIYTDGLGNLIYKLPRWNNVPLLDKSTFEAGPDSVLAELNEADEEVGKLTESFHGREYIMSDFGLISRKLYKTEEGKIARFFIQGTTDFQVEAAFSGHEGAPFNPTFDGSVMSPEFQALFGNRDAMSQIAIPLTKALELNRKTLEHLAQNLLIIMNFQSYTGDFVYKIPRPIELAKTVFSPENSYLYYVTSLSYAWRAGKEFNQSVHGEYGHPIWSFLPVPWMTKLQFLQGTNAGVTVTKRKLDPSEQVTQ